MKSDTTYIDTDTALAACCDELRHFDTLAVDTEFIRERTYFPKICLVQLAAGERIYLVDPLSIRQSEPLYALLNDSSITKVLHAARQDFEIFYHITGNLPAPMFDTQIAASLTGFADQIGYAPLVQELLGVELDKTQTRTDWSRRPLNDAQLHYAADDVRHLHAVHASLRERLEAAGRADWAEQDSATLCEPALYAIEPDNAWRRVKAANRMSGASRRALRGLSAWRENLAARRDLPRRWVVKDDVLVAIARTGPTDIDALKATDGLSSKLAERHGEDILLALGTAAPRAGDDEVQRRGPPDAAEKKLLKRLQTIVDDAAARTGVSAAVLAPRKEIQKAIGGHRDLPVFRGWRREILGEDIEAQLQTAAPSGDTGR